MSTKWTIVDDLQSLLDRVKAKPESEQEEFAYGVMQSLCIAYRPQAMKVNTDNKELDKKLLEIPAFIEAVKHCRAVLGVSLSEAADYVRRLKGI